MRGIIFHPTVKDGFIAPDISAYQGNVNFKTLKQNGYPNVIIRAGYGKNNIDQKWVPNVQACYNLGLRVDPYWFSYALNVEMAEREADYCIDAVSKYYTDCAIIFDLEYDSINYMRKRGVNPTKTLVNDMAVAFFRRVVARGYRPIIYTNRDFIRNWFDLNYINSKVGTKVELWFAYYSLNEPSEVSNGMAVAWQYTSKGKLSGISGNVDLNKVYTDIWGSGKEKTDTPCSMNLNIKSFQEAANADGYRDKNGCMLQEDGFDEESTKYVMKQINLKYKKIRMLWAELSTGEVVKWVQQRLNENMNANLAVTGEYDSKTASAVENFQIKYNLKVDKIAGYNTIQTMFWN